MSDSTSISPNDMIISETAEKYWSLDANKASFFSDPRKNNSKRLDGKGLHLYYNYYTKINERLPKVNPGDDSLKLEVDKLCNYIAELKYGKSEIEDPQKHQTFMGEIGKFLVPIKVQKVSRTNSRLIKQRSLPGSSSSSSKKGLRNLPSSANAAMKKDVKKIVKKSEKTVQLPRKLSTVKALGDKLEITEKKPEKKVASVYNHTAVLEVLSKNPHSRTRPEVRFLYNNFKLLGAFSKLSAFTLEQLCGVAHYSKYEADRVVFLQGDIGTSWYVILKGTVNVKITRTGNVLDSIVIKQLNVGDGFGDLALINDKPRAATIMTVDQCDFARIEKDDYNRILRFMHDRDIKERVSFLKKMKQFESWNEDSLKMVAGLYQLKSYSAGSMITKEKEEATHFYVVYSGICKGYRSLLIDGQVKATMVRKFESLDYFGERSLMNDEHVQYGISVKADTDTEIIVFSRYDALTRFKTSFEINKYLTWPANYLEDIYKEQIEERHMHFEKAKILDGIIRERKKDPTAKYSGNLDSTQKQWKY